MHATTEALPDFTTRLEQVRASGMLRVDLTETDPERCGIRWDRAELQAILGAGRGASPPARTGELGAAREAIASYLAGHRAAVRPDRILLAPSRSAARRLALAALCDSDGDVLAPAPARPEGDPASAGRVRPYRVEFDGAWRIDRRSLERAIGPRTRAVILGNPVEPTGAMPTPDDLAFLEELCADRGLALVGDEAFLDTALEASASVAAVSRCVGVHLSGLTGVSGLARLGGEWIAVTGPDGLAARVAARMGALAEDTPPPDRATVAAFPALLARREGWLERLRARLARNRGAIAAASLREAPWALQWGAGGTWAVLQINPGRDPAELCLELLDEGIAIRPGHLDGLPAAGYVVVSLLPEPDVLLAGLDRLEVHLRRLD